MSDNHFDYSNYFWQGETVRLRPVGLDDAEHQFIMSLDSPARQLLQLGIELPSSVELQKKELEKYVGCKDVDGVILFAIETIDGEFVGGLSFHTRNKKNGTFSLGIIIDREHRGNEYAVDAIRILLRYAFHERRYQKCNSACVDTNTASIKLHKKLGFIEEGRRRRHIYFNGNYHDDVLFGLTREEFDSWEQDHQRI